MVFYIGVPRCPWMALEEEPRFRASEPWVTRFSWARIAACRRRARSTSQRSLGGVSTRFGGRSVPRSVVTHANVESMMVSFKLGARPVDTEARLYSRPWPSPRGYVSAYPLWWERGWSFELRKRFGRARLRRDMTSCRMEPSGAPAKAPRCSPCHFGSISLCHAGQYYTVSWRGHACA